MRDGPSRDRLALQTQVDSAVLAAWDTARRAGDIERTLATLDPDRVTAEYKQARRTSGDDELEAALAQRFAPVQRLLNTLDDTDERLRLLDPPGRRSSRRRGGRHRHRPTRPGRRGAGIGSRRPGSPRSALHDLG